jgi:hypothetical protein
MVRIRRWLLWAVLGGLTAVAVYISVLAFPTPLFAYGARVGDFRVYSDKPIQADIGQVIGEVTRRARAMEYESGRSGTRVYLCNSPKRYSFFAFLTRRNPESLAIGLSMTNSMFVSMSRVRLFREKNGGLLRHTRFEGNLAEVIAHEIAHFQSIDALGYRAHLAQPVWKSEGWAEYQANLAAIRDDPAYDLAGRIDLLVDDRPWSDGSGLARELWEWQLLVEYLGEIEGLGLRDLIKDEVTRSSTTERMMSWYRQRRESHDGSI